MTAAAPVRLVAVDVDGTLLTSDHRITRAVAAALERVRARCGRLLTTSRPPARAVADPGRARPGRARVFVASQGALTGSYTEGGELRVIDRRPMPVELARAVVAAANAHPDVLAAADHLAPSNDHDAVAWVVDTLL